MPNPTPSVPSQPSSTPAPVAQPTKAPVSDISGGTTLAAKAPVAGGSDTDTWEVNIEGRTEKKSRKEILEAYQLRQLSDKKRSEADKVLAEYKKLHEVSKSDPIKFMKALGYDFDKLSTSYLAKKAEEAMMDPKERELQQAKAEAEQYKNWVKEQKDNQEKSQKEASINAEKGRIHQEIIEAIQESKELGMPVDEELVIQIAQKMILQDKKGKPLNAKEALPQAYASTQKWLQGMASKMEGESIVKWLGPEVAMKIRKYDLAMLKAKRAKTAPLGQALVKPQEQKNAPAAKPYKTWSQFKAETLDKIQ